VALIAIGILIGWRFPHRILDRTGAPTTVFTCRLNIYLQV
jgi:hypothetical protein